MSANSPTIDRMKIDGSKLRELREEKFMSRPELAEKSGLHADHIGRLERESLPGGSRLDNIRKLADALGIEPSELVKP